jgi:hyperosmotically inducible periplasmic protein
MKKLAVLLVSSCLLLGVAACDNNAKTSSSAPNTVEGTGTASNVKNEKGNTNDATSDVRKNQLNSDIRAHEQRNDMGGSKTNRADGDLESEVRSKLEANIPGGQLTVNAKSGAVTVGGSVPKSDQLSKIEPLAKQILGVKTVTVNAKVAAGATKN